MINASFLVPVDAVSHNVVKVILSDESVVVEVGVAEHLVEFLLGDVFAEFLSDLAKVINGELSLALVDIIPGDSCRRS